MKKYIVIALAALVAFTACTKTNPEEKKSSDKISFLVANYVPQTKANVSLLGETEQFKSKAFLHAAGVTTVQNYFGANGETIKWFADDKEWRPELSYYWPKDAASYINFVSWFDNTNATMTVGETEIKWAINMLPNDANFMVADEAWGYKNNVTTYKLDGQAEPVGVPTLFHHELAKLSINAKATTVSKNGTTWDITIEEGLVNNHATSAEVTLSTSEPSTTPATSEYTAVWKNNNTAGFGLTSPSGKLTTNAADYVLLNEKSIYPILLPNETLNFKIRIKAYHGTTLYSEEVITKSILFNTLGSPAITAWNANTKYTYTIIVNPETNIIKFDPAVEQWLTASAEYNWPEE